MYAVVTTGGKQMKVEKDTVAVVEKIDAPVGDSITLPALFMADGDAILFGNDAAAVTVTATIIEHFKGEKQIVFKFKKRKGYKKMRGHRQHQTALLITDISTGAPKKAAKAAKVEETVVEKPVAEKPVAKKPAAKKPAAAKETTVAEKPAAKKPAAEKPAAAKKTTAAEKPAAKKPAAKKPADAAAAKPAAKKPAAKKPAAKKPAAKKTTSNADEAAE